MKKSIPERIKSFNSDRDPRFLAYKYKAMREDKYRFFRATTHIFYEDIHANSFLRHSPHTWICGDMHLENFGSYKGDKRVAHFNLNDFDECLLGPCLFDISRMLCSIYISAQSLGITLMEATQLGRVFTSAYFQCLCEGYIRVLERETAKGVMKKFLEDVANRKRKIFIKRRVITKKGRIQLLCDDRHASSILANEKDLVTKAIHSWTIKTNNDGFYDVKDVAHRIAGTSSLGLKRYVILVEGMGSPNKNYLLDLKETRKSCVEDYVGVKQPAWKTEATRIVEVQKRILADPPALLNSLDIKGRNFVLKELQPTADRIDYTLFHNKTKKLREILADMGRISAWGTLRSSGRQGSAIADELISFGKKEKMLLKELQNFAHVYSQEIHSQYLSYCKAYDKKYFEKK